MDRVRRREPARAVWGVDVAPAVGHEDRHGATRVDHHVGRVIELPLRAERLVIRDRGLRVVRQADPDLGSVGRREPHRRVDGEEVHVDHVDAPYRGAGTVRTVVAEVVLAHRGAAAAAARAGLRELLERGSRQVRAVRRDEGEPSPLARELGRRLPEAAAALGIVKAQRLAPRLLDDPVVSALAGGRSLQVDDRRERDPREVGRLHPPRLHSLPVTIREPDQLREALPVLCAADLPPQGTRRDALPLDFQDVGQRLRAAGEQGALVAAVPRESLDPVRGVGPVPPVRTLGLQNAELLGRRGEVVLQDLEPAQPQARLVGDHPRAGVRAFPCSLISPS